MRAMLWLFGLLVAVGACAVTPINIPYDDGKVKVPGDVAAGGMDAPLYSHEAGSPKGDVPAPSAVDGGAPRDAGGERASDLKGGELRPGEAGPGGDAVAPLDGAGKKKELKP